MSGIALRDADIDDAAAIAQVHVASWRVAYRGLMPDEVLDGLSIPERTAGWRERLRENPTLVAVEDGVVVGFCALRLVPGTIPYVAALYLEPAVLRRGIGTALLDETARRLRAAGETAVELSVLVENHSARAFYAARGFAEVDKRDEWHGGEELRLRLCLPS